MAIEIVDLPINSMGGSFHSYVTVYQRVSWMMTPEMLGFRLRGSPKNHPKPSPAAGARYPKRWRCSPRPGEESHGRCGVWNLKPITVWRWKSQGNSHDAMVLIRVYAIFWWSNPAKPSMHIHAWYEPNLGLTGQFITGTKQPAIDDTIFAGERSLSNQLFEKPTNWEAIPLLG